MAENSPRYRPPGALEPGAEPEIVMMICTAGHVDHGKTKLVKLLTGCNTDRLKIEQERGLTIELGFAPCVLDGEIGVGIVDVPGHEKFIRNMVAGVSGIEMAILVIAANDCIMPQTVEHLRIMEFMGISRGIVAVSKTDLVPPEILTEAISEIRVFLKGTFLENAPVCPVSSETFEGYSEFYTVLASEVRKLVKKKRPGIFRMPVEQVFSRRGYGIVVMGIPIEGFIEVGDQVEIVPGGRTGKVRGIQQFLRDTGRGEYGQCLALNIPDFTKTPPVRGDVISLPGYLAPSGTVFVRLHAIPGLERPLKNAEEIKFHTGTAEEMGKLYLLEDKTLAGGESALAAIVLNTPVVAAVHDRFIIRRSSPAETVAGGEALALSETSQKPRKRQALEQMYGYEFFMGGADPAGSEGIERRIEYFLLTKGAKEASLDEISKGALLPKMLVSDVLAGLVERGRVRPLGADTFIHTDPLVRLLQEVRNKLDDASRAGKLTFSQGDLQQGFDLSQRLWKSIEEEFLHEGILERRGSTFILSEAKESLSEIDRRITDDILAIYRGSEFRSPRTDELPGFVSAPEKTIGKLMEYLYGIGLLIKLDSNVVLSREAFRKAQDMVVALIREKGELDSADFKYSIDSSRKYALAILDRLDSMHVTIRSGNIRTLSPDYEKRMIT
jgi:selenocysteine-specific elongation factor